LVFAPASLILTNYFLPLSEALGEYSMSMSMTDELITSTSDLYSNDINYIVSHIEEDETGYWARSLIKTVVSFYEAEVFILKCDLIKFCKEENIFILPEILMFLKDTKYDMKENGDIKEKYNQTTLKTDIKFIFKQFCDLRCFTLKADYSENRWSQLINTINVRNRLTHPKALTSQTVTEIEIEDCIASFEWFNANCTFFISQHSEYLKTKISTLKVLNKFT
jgi:hypothetical protein